MIKLLITIVLSTILLLSSCQKKSSPSIETGNVQKQMENPPKKEFEPPADSVISFEQMKAWLLCNTLLDSLTIMYSDSFKTTDPSLRMRYQEDFSAAQNKLCIRAGLPGGYKEYTWIMKNTGNPKNKKVLNDANAAVH